MDYKEEKILNENYKENIINVNGKNYIDAETFMDAIYNISLSEAIIGVLVSKLGGKAELDRKDIVNFMAEGYNNVITQYTKDKCLIDIK